ncbi:ATP-grasp fold amidoligase family protein [Psychrosphaera algicola]|uniref:ATP-grasp fold amidoligase family protein n=1 Tax=Psychrosphaera algicola TaxID=3023714 RepID=A0ABT5FCG6_9GAMM|nr:ATP-grasp fold amidoligase family protein [Psychrosphaera sp. G1-22]MDC2889244.1 ATP-grasp fold amidoligase family protein [Psychrosphaera sp. G1-22]
MLSQFELKVYSAREKIQNIVKTTIKSDESFLKKKFKKRLGYKLNLEKPKTFSEKIQWRKIYDRNSLYVVCADKYAVRDYVSEKIGKRYLVPLIGSYKTANDIDFDNLPNQFVIKASHGSGWNIIVKDKKYFCESKAKKQLNKWLIKNFYPRKREWQYKDIQPRLVVEEMLTDSTGSIPADFKFHVFNSGAQKEIFIQVDSDRFGDHTRDYFDQNWNLLELRNKYPNSEKLPEKPVNLAEMLVLAEKLATDFSFVRVDLYSVGNKVYFGELTFCPEAGFARFEPESVDLEWGEKYILPNEI